MSISIADRSRNVLAEIAALVDAIPAEFHRLAEYLNNPGAGRDAAGRSSEAQADLAHLSAYHVSFKNVLAVKA